MLVSSLGWEDTLEDEMATDSQYSCWENPMDRGSWRTTVHRIFQARVLEWGAIAFSEGFTLLVS